MRRDEAMRAAAKDTLRVIAPTIVEQQRRIATAGADAELARVVAFLRQHYPIAATAAADALEARAHWPKESGDA